MRFIKRDIDINFIGKKKITFILSALMILAGIGSLVAHKGPKYGVDFAGGTLIQVQFPSPVNIQAVKDGLAEMDLAQSSVQTFGDAKGNEYLIRTKQALTREAGIADQIKDSLGAMTGSVPEIRRVDMVGPQVGEDLRKKALLALFYALLFIAIYISGRFEMKWLVSGALAAALMSAVYFLSLFDVGMPFLIGSAIIVTLVFFWFLKLKYAMGAAVALLHDVLITVGIFSIFDKEFTLPIVAALLTIIGYSLNDTIIVFDRIRENQRKLSKKPLSVVINRSINETLSRTVLTSLTTLAVLAALFVLGGGIIHDFAFAMIIGVIVGTYSSMYVASPLLLAWEKVDG
ncbi:Protein translocase subunit SecF [Candidatus Desulfarcum epimagneticum]|uniref:Protein-export membrane protein SecF n=1 Tax=uncultured Desulfobacteraceae bacterium TaxID=218296 RepID=A0A484HLK3_9BACT|nr:Protein translocase subunit SecF [uncultured Desulfobacteraceae bacterium]